MEKLRKTLAEMIDQVLTMLILLFLASGIGYLFRTVGFPETNIVIVYLLAVLLTACRTNSYVYGIIASLIATFSFNYFFTAPKFTFSVEDPSYIITFTIMTITAIVASTLTSHVKQSAIEASEKEAITKALYRLTNHLTDAVDMHDIASIATSIISDIMDCRAACLCFDETGSPEKTFIQQVSPGKQVHRDFADNEEFKHHIEGLRTGYCVGREFYDWLIYGRDNILGVIRIPSEKAVAMTESQTRLLRAMIESIALAMDRFRAAEQRIRYREETVQERYRGNLLRAISHDLRTPLSGIMGTSEMLMDMTNQNDPRYSLAEAIHSDADWLHSLVENILSLTRLQEGRLILNKTAEAAEEVIGGAVRHFEQLFQYREIKTDCPEELLLVPMDAKLIQQVIVNLLDNAIKHTPAEKEISISVFKDEQKNLAVFTIADRGEGIAEADHPNVFQMFYTSKTRRADAKHGIGLGLAICDAIVKAHGGTIKAKNRPDGGAEFTFTLPLEVMKNQDLG
jgi:two-component system sensor histidine kinase KdpD